MHINKYDIVQSDLSSLSFFNYIQCTAKSRSIVQPVNSQLLYARVMSRRLRLYRYSNVPTSLQC